LVFPCNIDGDGHPEIIIADNYKLYVLNRDRSRFPGWTNGVNIDNQILTSSPVVADIDGDGQMEIFLISTSLLNILYGFHFDGTPIVNFPKHLPSRVLTSLPFSPVIGDFNSNGLIDLFFLDNSPGNKMYFWEFSGQAMLSVLAWSMFQHDPQHTGRY